MKYNHRPPQGLPPKPVGNPPINNHISNPEGAFATRKRHKLSVPNIQRDANGYYTLVKKVQTDGTILQQKVRIVEDDKGFYIDAGNGRKKYIKYKGDISH